MSTVEGDDFKKIYSVAQQGAEALSNRTEVAKNTPIAIPNFVPGEWDVICTREKAAFNHVGNRNFRRVIEDSVEAYIKTTTKLEKTIFAINLVDKFRKNSKGGGFVKFCKERSRYVEIGDQGAREKVGQRAPPKCRSIHIKKIL